MLLNPALRDFWTVKARNRVLYGGRASSKSHDAAGMAIYLARNYRVKFLCTRQFQNRIEDSVYTLLKSKIEDFGMGPDFDVLKSSIVCPETGSEFIFYGRARNIEEIKGTEGVDIHWAEECELLTAEEWRVIDPTIRKDGSQHWLIFNPKFATDFVYQNFVIDPPSGSVVRQINYPENPFLSQTMLDLIEEVKTRDPEEHEHVYLGVPLSDGDRVVIQRKWIEAAIDAHIKLGIEVSGKRQGGLDVADEGADLNAFAGRKGILLDYLEAWSGKGSDIYATVERAFEISDQEGYTEFAYDGDGLGAGTKGDARKLNEGRDLPLIVRKFQGSAKVIDPEGKIPQLDGSRSKDKDERTNKDYFANMKAQAWWSLRMRFLRTYQAVALGHSIVDSDALISISGKMPRLAALCLELAQPTYSENGAGKLLINKQPEGAKSPNLADSVMICFAPTEPERRGFFDLP